MKTSLPLVAQAFLFAGMVATAVAAEPPIVPLWTDTAPGSEGKNAAEKVRITDEGDHVVSSVHRPSLTVYLPSGSASANAAVLVIPGGGHRELWMDHEGYNVAQWLADHGIAAFVLKYRLAREEGSSYRVDVESLQDVRSEERRVGRKCRWWDGRRAS